MEFFEELLSFIGRWHPLFVHLPIGMIFVAFIMALASRYERFKSITPAISFTLLLGAIAAIFAGLTGYFLSENGGYENETLDFHKWSGVAVIIFSLFTFFLYNDKNTSQIFQVLKRYRLGFLFVATFLLAFTGHYGGSLTHGKGYLKDALPTAIKDAIGIEEGIDSLPLLENVQEAEVYSEIIQPILIQRCQSCHGSKKQEGGLALHEMGALLKGGDSGAVVEAGSLENSSLYARLILPEGDEERMPPKGRTPIDADQIQLIGWWVESGADFSIKVKDIEQTEGIAAILKRLEAGEDDQEDEFSRLAQVSGLSNEIVEQLQEKGIKVLPVSATSDFVSINTINYPEFNDQDMQELLKIKDNVIQLKLGSTLITDKAMESIKDFPNLMKLHIEKTQITDQGLTHLRELKNLSYINLLGLDVSNEGLKNLEQIPTLRSIYAYQTNITKESVDNLNASNAELLLDTGAYQLPFLSTDTIIY